MTDDDTDAAWHQLELECWQQLLENDPDYENWLNETKETNDEIPRETQ